jgi:hypothetical protein
MLWTPNSAIAGNDLSHPNSEDTILSPTKTNGLELTTIGVGEQRPLQVRVEERERKETGSRWSADGRIQAAERRGQSNNGEQLEAHRIELGDLVDCGAWP